MSFHGGEQLDESAADMRTNRLVLERAGNAKNRTLVRRHRKVIGPKVDQTFCKRPGGESRALSARQDLCAVVGQRGITHGIADGRSRSGGRGRGRSRSCRLAFHILKLFARRLQFGENRPGRFKPRIPHERHSACDLRQEPAARIACCGGEIPKPGPQTEPQHRYFGLHHASVTAETPGG
ncbi:MAG TPA: hypothetical protein VGO37_04520 [Steroidobacteraceae bacterium]|nr:hypothetical protein [Steroidobacteraceae bacterium]